MVSDAVGGLTRLPWISGALCRKFAGSPVCPRVHPADPIGYAVYVGAVLGTIRRHMQFAEFETLPDHPGKRELLSGELIELPPAKQKHNQIAERIYLRLREILPEAGNPSLGEVHHEMGYLFDDGSWLQPYVSITHFRPGGGGLLPRLSRAGREGRLRK